MTDLPEEPDLITKIHSETAQIAWSELQTFLRRGWLYMFRINWIWLKSRKP